MQVLNLNKNKLHHRYVFKILLLLQSCNSRPHRYANFQFLILSGINAPHNVPTPHISKSHLPIHLMYVNSNWSDVQKTSYGKQEVPLPREEGGWKPNYLRKALRFIKRSFVTSQRYVSSECSSILLKFCQWCMSWNELKWTQMSSKELEWI